jgi:peptidyl-prolyl cis-trans isomerase C
MISTLFTFQFFRLHKTACVLWAWMLLGVNTLAQTPSTDVQQALARPFVSVNGQTQTTAHAEVLFRERIAQGAASSPELRESVRDHLINQALMVQAGQADGLDRHPLVQAQMTLASQATLVKLWQQKFLAEHPITDSALEQEYKRQIALMGTEELLIRHIVVAEEDVAKRLIQRIQQGESWTDLALEHSIDVDSKTQGGLVGWVPQRQLIAEVSQIVNTMRPGQLWSAPVRSSQGWHVLSLQDRRPLIAPELAKLRPQLLELMAQKILNEQILSMRQKALIQ